jgi:spore coat protein U-like protein
MASGINVAPNWSWSQKKQELCLAAKIIKKDVERRKKKEEETVKKFVLAVMVLALLTVTGTAFAATASTSLSVTANVQDACRISSNPGTVDFGTYDPTDTSPNIAGQTSFGYKCSKGTNYKVYITRTKQMLMGTDSLSYDLYSDAGRTVVFPAVAADATQQTSANNGEVTVNIYGKIPAGQDVSAGVHTETDTITIDY